MINAIKYFLDLRHRTESGEKENYAFLIVMEVKCHILLSIAAYRTHTSEKMFSSLGWLKIKKIHGKRIASSPILICGIL